VTWLLVTKNIIKPIQTPKACPHCGEIIEKLGGYKGNQDLFECKSIPIFPKLKK
jgi:hypothetical protein